jgi:hypothetical protein
MDEVEARIRGRDMAVDKLQRDLGMSGSCGALGRQGVGNCGLVKMNDRDCPHEDNTPAGVGIWRYPRAMQCLSVGIKFC